MPRRTRSVGERPPPLYTNATDYYGSMFQHFREQARDSRLATDTVEPARQANFVQTLLAVSEFLEWLGDRYLDGTIELAQQQAGQQFAKNYAKDSLLAYELNIEQFDMLLSLFAIMLERHA